MPLQSSSRHTELFQAASNAARAGRLDEAITHCQHILKLSPGHLQALNMLGNLHMQANAPEKALDAFRLLTERERHPVPLYNLAVAQHRTGDFRGALSSLEQSLALNPYFSQALYEKAVLLLEAGKKAAAAVWFRHFLQCAENDPGREALAPMIRHAEAVRDEHMAALESFLAPKLGPLAAELPPEARGRMSECVDIFLGKAVRRVPDPNFLYVPRLPAFAFYDRALFPWLPELEAATDDIRSELKALIDFDGAAQGFKPYIQRPESVPKGEFAALNHSSDWSVFMFWEHGKRIEENCARCPKTSALLDRLPLCVTPNRTPTANFSLLRPHTRIPAHCGETNSRLIVHLPLIVPENCRFRVGNETRPWIEGEAFVFDDSMNHEAWNDSGSLRAILMFDVWNPLISDAERKMISELVRSADAFAAM